MDRLQHFSYKADDRSYYALIKKDIHKLAAGAGFSQSKLDAIDIVLAEITSNLHKHAEGGEILAAVGNESDNLYLEMISIDDGPGIGDLSKVLTDGYSSMNTLGHGLGSIKRLSDQFDMFSLRGWGTVLLSRIYDKPLRSDQRKRSEIRGINIPIQGEEFSGDGFCFMNSNAGFRLFAGDGLGHGEGAYEAVTAACKAFIQLNDMQTPDILREVHKGIKRTRGAVGVTVLYDAATRKFTAAGIGNMTAKWIGPDGSKSFNSYNGIIGMNIPGTISEIKVDQEDFPLLIICSDGIKTRWDLSKFPSIQRHDAAVIAASVYKEFGRRTDDTSVIVCKTI